MRLRFPELPMLPLARYARLLRPDQYAHAMARMEVLRALFNGRAIWNVSSTAVGGGVAEMVRAALAYARGAGIDARWVVIEGSPEFFRITKHVHNAIHGADDGVVLDSEERDIYEAVIAANATELLPMVRARDVVIIHDPQPAGLIPLLVARGAHVIWRCHIGHDELNDSVERGWQFLERYLRPAHAYVFSRPSYVPATHIEVRRTKIITPSIDPFSAKNQPLVEPLSILAQAGLIAGAFDSGTFLREDGTPSRVDHAAQVIREGGPPSAKTPLVVQVSRWDRLKDPSGVLEGFARLDTDAHLVLAGPDLVADDPESEEVFADVKAQWRALSATVRRRVHLALIPTIDVDENAAIVNALQRHAAVIVQKSLHEGFGLTVTEAMWKARPVVASAVGGIQDQIEHGIEGLLLDDPTDLDAFAAAVKRLLDDPAEAAAMGARGHTRVMERYLALGSLLRYGALIEWLDESFVDHRASQTA